MIDPFFMYNSRVNPVDLYEFMGLSQTDEGRKKKLIKLYKADAEKALKSGDMRKHKEIMDKIDDLNGETNK